jgi:TolB-like protein/Flp pilus assembly protein TadD
MAGFWFAKSRPATTPIDSIAVLPFISNDAANNYLADGLSEVTINGLSRVAKLRVVPRTNVLRYNAQSMNPQQAGQELGVGAILTGQVSQKDDVLTIQLDLIDVRRDSEIFTSQYTGKSSDLISLQTRIFQDVSRALKVSLTEPEQQLLTHRVTENADAYRAYLEGRYFWNQRSESGLKKAIEGFERATQIDSNFALAYSGLADSYTTLGYLSYISPTRAFPVAKNYALKAIELDPTLSEPHASLAYDKFYFDWDWSGAESEFRRATELNPNYATAHQWYSVYLLAAGRSNEAFHEIYQARQCDPLSLSINTDIGFHHYYNRQYDEAIKQLMSVLEMKKDFPLAHLWLGRSYQQLGRYQEALTEFRQVEGAFGGWAVSKAALGYVEGVSGNHREAAKTLSELEALSKQRFITAYGVALVYAGMGEKDKAFEWLNKAFDERSHWLVWLRLDPRWDVLRSDPRFGELLDRMHFL